MTGRPLIRLLTTGGTIATTLGAGGRSGASLSPQDLTSDVTEHSVRLESTELTRVPSWRLSADDMLEVALAARDAAADPDVTGVVVTHGTTTLEYTAFLTELVSAAEAPIVFTGAMRRADHDKPDGPRNLSDAIHVALSPQTRGLGVIIAFAGQLLDPRTTWKRHRTAVDAFEDLDGPVGFVSPEEVTIARRPTKQSMILGGRIATGVALVKAYPGAGPSAVDAALADGSPGIVIEALPGSGGLPPGMTPAVQRAAEAGLAVVIAPRSPAGRTPEPPTGGTGEPLESIPLLSAGELSAEKAWVLLSVALAQGDEESTAELFRSIASLED